MTENVYDNQQKTDCNYKRGRLNPCSPLAASYVPHQQTLMPVYSKNDALTRGTLFPGLDLPFMNNINENNPYSGTPLGELMAINFVINELNLYLDTHKDDMEAFGMLKKMLSLYNEGKEKYIAKYGPISVSDLSESTYFDWLEAPWPWEYCERKEK